MVKMVRIWRTPLIAGALGLVALACRSQESGLMEQVTLPGSAAWRMEGRGTSSISGDILRLEGCEAVYGDEQWKDYELQFSARAPKECEQMQIWTSVRRTSRDSRYTIGLRGGNHNHIYMARYAPWGAQLFLGTAPLKAPPTSGAWVDVRIAVQGQTIKVFLNGEAEPAMMATDSQTNSLTRGAISLGGGYLPAEFKNIRLRRLQASNGDDYSPRAIRLNFQPAAEPPIASWQKVTGEAFSPAKGMGWATSLKSGERKRNHVQDLVRDTLVSVAGAQQENAFHYTLPDGDYLVTLLTGDPLYAIQGDVTFCGATPETFPVVLRAGQAEELTRKVVITNGLLRLRVRRTGSVGFSMQGLVIERKEDVGLERWKRFTLPGPAERLASAKAEQREQERQQYKVVPVKTCNVPRMDVSLDGKWLFLPDYEVCQGLNYAAAELDDSRWHVMDVPAFWTTADNWLYDERQGGSERWVALEAQRLGAYTFDWKRVKAAWYRHAFELDRVVAGSRYELCFDAIAKVSDLYVNGQHVTKHVGMFKPCQVDITPWVRSGRNQIALHVRAVERAEEQKQSDKVETVAVTVAVTERMLKSLPQAIYCGKPGGIWQPAKLVIHQSVQISDIFFRPRLDGASIELTLENRSPEACSVTPQIAFKQKATGVALKPLKQAETVVIPAHTNLLMTVDTGALRPDLWSPDTPNLYGMTVTLQQGAAVVDQQTLDVGFRTFEARKDGKLYLNGHRYWLRGACHTPMPTCPMDAAMADTFTRLMHDGNVRVTRTVCAPWNELWLSSADRNGVGVSQEGVWPWLMINGKVPEPDLLAYWREEHLALIRKYRNHPSILFWTVNNESYYVRLKDPKELESTMTVLSDVIKEMRRMDPTRPICPDSGGVLSLAPPFYEKLAREKGFDYGDIDDKHEYPSWYEGTFFKYYPQQGVTAGRTGKGPAKQLNSWVTPGRPMISQEMSTGYPNADDGHPVRKYIFDHMVPQSFVGDYAYEHQNPAYFLESVRFNTQELAETLRAYYRDSWAGVVHFALNCWFQNLFESDRIKAYPVATSLATALQPVLVSARLYGRHHYAGKKLEASVFVMNDDEQFRDLGPMTLRWTLEHAGKVLACGEAPVAPVANHANGALQVTVALPQRLPAPRIDALWRLVLQEGTRVVSTNQYALTLADASWVQARPRGDVYALDPQKKSAPLWAAVGCEPRWESAFQASTEPSLWVIHDYAAFEQEAAAAALRTHVEQGGRLLLNAPGDVLAKIFPAFAQTYREGNGEIVNMRIPESPLFNGIEVMDLRWFDCGRPETPIATHGRYLLAGHDRVTVLAQHIPVHGYLRPELKKDQDGAVIFLFRFGKGLVCVTQLAHERGVHDPIPARVFKNMVEWLSERTLTEQ